MKVEFTDVSETQKSVAVEIPTEVVGGEIERVAKQYARSARLPGFRPGKIPAKVIRQRFKQQILHDVAHDLIPRAVESALRERGVEPVDTPNITDVTLEEGQPLTFTAAFETTPPIDPGDYGTLALHRAPIAIDAAQVDRSLERLRENFARFEPIEDRGAEQGDSVVMQMTRRVVLPESEAGAEPEKLENVAVEIGAPANPPGFDEHLLGLKTNDEKTFRVTFPPDYPVDTLAGRELEYAVQVTGLRRKVLPNLDDEFAKDLEYESLDAVRQKVDENLRQEAQRKQQRDLRQELLQQLATRVTFDAPEPLVRREMDRRVEEFVRQLIDQRVDPSRTSINWEEMREQQRDPATETVKCALVLDEIARREQLAVEDAEIDQEIERFAAGAGQPAPEVRQRLEQEGAISRIYTGLRREKAIDFALSRATIHEG